MKKCTRRQPEVESLEPLRLLSATAHGARALAQVAPVPVTLAGTIQATARVKGHGLTVTGSGDLGPVGPATLQLSTRDDIPSYSFTLGTRRGKLILVGDAPIAAATAPGTTHYRVIGGTGAYARVTGSGLASVTPGTPSGGRTPLALTFS